MDFYDEEQQTLLGTKMDLDLEQENQRTIFIIEQKTTMMFTDDEEPTTTFIDEYEKIHGPLVISICVFGIVSNLVNIIILTRRNMLGPTNVLLTGLSSAQLLLLFNYLIYTTYVILDRECESSTKTYFWLSYLLLNVNLNLVFHTIALVHTTCLAVFRYVAVAYPVTCKCIVSISAARRAVIGAFISVPLVCTTFYPNSVVVMKNLTDICQSTDNERSAGDDTILQEEMYELRYHPDRHILRDYNFWFFGTVCKLLPCTLLVGLSLLLIRELSKVRKRRKRWTTSRSQQKERHGRQITTMLVVIVSMFVAVELPQGIFNMLTAIWKDDFIDTYTSMGDFFEMLTVLYSSVTFILYCTMSRQYRMTFSRIFFGFRPEQLSVDEVHKTPSTLNERSRLKVGPWSKSASITNL